MMMKCHFNDTKKRSVDIQILNASAPSQSYQPDDLIDVEFNVAFKIKREAFNRFRDKTKLFTEFSLNDFEAMIERRK
jgi:hypothetical protein